MLRPVFYIIGIILLILAVGMVICGAVDFYYREGQAHAFFASAFFSLFVGGALVFSNQQYQALFGLRQLFLLTALGWAAASLFAALPLIFMNPTFTFVDGLFEAFSALTTTGATILPNPETVPHGLLLWRALLGGIGGASTLILCFTILPILKIGGVEIFRREENQSTHMPAPARGILKTALQFYLCLITCTAGGFWLTGMGWFDALCYGLSTVSTTGFANHLQGIGFFQNRSIEIVAMLSMLASGVPFLLYVQMLRGSAHDAGKNAQLPAYLFAVAFFAGLFIIALSFSGISAGSAIHQGLFNSISMITSTGYLISPLGSPILYALIVVMCLGFSCYGSPASGLKIFRFQVFATALHTRIRRLIQPHGIFLPYYGNRPLSQDIILSVAAFLLLAVLFWICLWIALAATDVPLSVSLTAALSALSGNGAGLSALVGGHYAALPDAGKIVLVIGMWAGRVDILPVILLFTGYLWRD